MKRHEEQAPGELRAALETWDPVRREGEPAAEEVAGVRRRVLVAAPGAAVPWMARWRPVVVVAAAAALVVVVLRAGGPGEPGSPRPEAVAGAPRASGEVDPSSGRPAVGAAPVPGPAGAAAGRQEAEATARPATRRSPRRGEVAPSGSETGSADPTPPTPAVERARPPAGAGGADSPPSSAARTAVASLAAAESPPEAPALAGPPPGDAAPLRQVQIIAPGGTRIVWMVAAGPDRATDSPEEDT